MTKKKICKKRECVYYDQIQEYVERQVICPKCGSPLETVSPSGSDLSFTGCLLSAGFIVFVYMMIKHWDTFFLPAAIIIGAILILVGIYNMLPKSKEHESTNNAVIIISFIILTIIAYFWISSIDPKPDYEPAAYTNNRSYSGTDYTVYANPGANLRSSPNGRILLTVPNGESVKVLDTSNSSWYEVRYNGTEGYIHSSLLVHSY